MKYAEIRDNTVSHIIEGPADLAGLYHPDYIVALKQCGNDVQPGWTYDGKKFAAPVVTPVNIDVVKEGAKAQLSAMLDTAAATLTGNAPLAEQLSWSAKQDAARAFLAGTTTGEQKILLEAESSITGETVEALCAVILASADAYALAVGKIAGLRRKLSKAIDDCATVECVAGVLAAATEALKGGVAE